MAGGSRGLGRFESVVAFVAGAVIGSEVARRSGDRARSALDDLRWRADRLRDRTEDLLERVDLEGVRAVAPHVGETVLERIGNARLRAETVRARTLELGARASDALGRAGAALERLDDAVGRFRPDRRRPRRVGPRRLRSPIARPEATPATRMSPPSTTGSAMRQIAGTVDVDDPIADGAKRLLDAPDGVLVALDGERIAGVLSQRDVLGTVAARLDPTTAAISDVMRAVITSIPPSATLEEAAVLVKYLHVDELVVAEDGRPLGVLRAGDLPR